MKDVNDITPEPLPEEAAAALERSGMRLLRQLEGMRGDDSAEIELEPLDARAALALRRHGDVLLDRLEMQRPAHQQVATKETRKRRIRKRKRKHWSAKASIGLAASLAGLLAMIQFTAGPPEPATPVVQQPVEPAVQPPAEDPQVPPTVAVPEPSSTLLALCGALCLLSRRRRPS